jgi:hypothetical protein
MFITITSSSFHRRAHKQTCTHMTRHATDHINKMKPKTLFCWNCALKSNFSHNLYQIISKAGQHAYKSTFSHNLYQIISKAGQVAGGTGHRHMLPRIRFLYFNFKL